MACTNNRSCGSCNNCGYGTLSTVAGPLVNCGCGCTNPQYYQNFPFYNGPCGCVSCDENSSSWRRNSPWSWWNRCNSCNSCNSCNNCGGWNNRSCGCGCDNGWNHWNHWGSCATVRNVGDCSSAAHFVANSPVLVEAGGTVPLVADLCSSDYEVCADGSVLIHRPGTYMAIHSLHVPAMQTLSTQMFLTLNGNPLDATAQDVTRIADGTAGGSTRHSIFRAWPNSELRLISGSDIALNNSDCTNVFSLTLIRID